MTQFLQNIFDNAILPMLLLDMGIAFPFIGIILKIPVLGSGIKQVIQWSANWLIAKGVIELKVGLIDILSAKAQAAYADEIKIIREAQSQPSLTPEQQAEYAKRLQDVVKNRPGIVNA